MIGKNVQKFCCEPIENIENYCEAIKDEALWECHHKDEIDKGLSRKELVDAGLYFNIPAERLIFLRQADHVRLHHKDKIVSIETREKQSEGIKNSEKYKNVIHKGKDNAMYGKSKELSPVYIDICPELLYDLRVNKKMKWREIANELNISLPCVRRKFKELICKNLT